jgi:hypothetical protein
MRERTHDDLVPAVALAAWWRNEKPQPMRFFYSDHMVR